MSPNAHGTRAGADSLLVVRGRGQARGTRAPTTGVGGTRWAAVLAVLVVALASCTTTVAGSGGPASDIPVPTIDSSVPPPVLTTVPEQSATSAPPATRAALAPDVVDDECLLDASAVGALAGAAVRPPRQRTDADGSSCVAESSGGTPVATVDVYEPRTGSPADFVRGGPQTGRRPLDGAGEAAVVVDTAPGSVLQVAGARYVVTIAVLDGTPSDDAWRTAARTALEALPT